MFGNDHKVKRLEQIPILSRCSTRDLRAVASRADVVPVRKGEVVRHNGRERSFLVLLDGTASCSDGRTLEPGDTYGAAGLLRRERETDEVRMLTDGHVMIVGARAFSGLIYTVPGFALGVAEDLARRVA